LDFSYKGGVTTAGAEQVTPPENVDAYPQYDMFGMDMPAYGLYVRHAQNVTLKGIKFSYDSPDNRPAVVFDKDVSGHKLFAPIEVESGAGTTPYPVWHRGQGGVPVGIAVLPVLQVNPGKRLIWFDLQGRRLPLHRFAPSAFPLSARP